MKPAVMILAMVLAALQFAVADGFKTVEGKEYKNVTVKRVEPDGLVLSRKSGISKVYFTELPKDVQQRYGYDAEKAAAYSAEQNAALEQARKQQEEATAKRNEQLAKEQAGVDWTTGQRQKIQALQARYNDLQQQEDNLLSEIGARKSEPRGSRRTIGNSGRSELPRLQSDLADVRREKDQVRQQLEQLQR
jgi:hypothetical protein